MSRYEDVRFESGDGIATVTLHRPEKRNAFTPRMGEELLDAFRRARDDDEVRALVITGAGRGFCSGVDLEVLRDPRQTGRISSGEFLQRFPIEVAESPMPVIAAMNGAAIGVGVTLALPCDVRIAALDAKLGLTFAKLGILPGLGSSHLLPKLVGRAKALELVLTARVIEGREAERIGLVNRAVPAGDVLATAHEMAREMAGHAPEVLAHAKQSLHFGADATLAEALANEPQVNQSLAKAKAAAKRSG